MIKKRVLAVLTNHDRYSSGHKSTGLWLGELVHIYHELLIDDYEVGLVSPNGGKVPLDPVSISPLFIDKLSGRYLKDDQFRRLLEATLAPNQINPEDYSAIYFAGGHGAMWDFPDNGDIAKIAGIIYENGGIISAICHGSSGLLNIKVGNDFLISGKRVTGYSWNEEFWAGRKNLIPFNLQSQLQSRGAVYSKAPLPFIPHVVIDGRLVTGQNPQSSRKIAKNLIKILKKI